jgi:hypothetical protein
VENILKMRQKSNLCRKSTEFLKQMLYATRAWSKYLSKRNLKIKIGTRESGGRNLNFGEILIFFTGILI